MKHLDETCFFLSVWNINVTLVPKLLNLSVLVLLELLVCLYFLNRLLLCLALGLLHLLLHQLNLLVAGRSNLLHFRLVDLYVVGEGLIFFACLLQLMQLLEALELGVLITLHDDFFDVLMSHFDFGSSQQLHLFGVLFFVLVDVVLGFLGVLDQLLLLLHRTRTLIFCDDLIVQVLEVLQPRNHFVPVHLSSFLLILLFLLEVIVVKVEHL